MKKSKGFTLIELLAVIVVLAVISLIAVPIVLSLVNNAKENAFERSIVNASRALEYYLSEKKFSKIPEDGINISDLALTGN